MMRLKALIGSTVAAALLTVLWGCSTPSEDGGGMSAPPFGGKNDLKMAQDLWTEISGRGAWNEFPGHSGFQKGESPHGKFVRYAINSNAAKNTENFEAGSVIVKENYMARDAGSLGAITVMKKVWGYDPENGDWFWAKYMPNGQIAKNPMGMPLAGRVAKGMDKGCIACHQNAGDDDFVFVNDG